MKKQKRIKIKYSYYAGHVENERFMLTAGNALFDVSDSFTRLPDDVQLAFKAWQSWEKVGKDVPFRGVELDDEESLYSRYGLLKNAHADLNVLHTPIICQVSVRDIRVLQFKKDKSPAYIFVEEDSMNLAYSIFGGELELFTRGENGPVLLRMFGIPVGLIGVCSGAVDFLERQGLAGLFASSL